MSGIGTDPQEPVEGARTFQVPGRKYDDFMGRYSKPLASGFADAAGVRLGMTALDLGCGPGALTGALTDGIGATAVSACDPSPSFVAECARRHPGVVVRQGSAEAIPFEDNTFDAVLIQLVLHFVTDPETAAAELARVLRPGGVIGACVWDSDEGMQMLSHFWKAALSVDLDISPRTQQLRFGAPGEIVSLLAAAGFDDLSETTMTVSSTYDDFDELWAGFLAGIGPAGAYCLGLPADVRAQVRSHMFQSVGSPTGSFSMDATARCAFGRAPS